MTGQIVSLPETGEKPTHKKMMTEIKNQLAIDVVRRNKQKRREGGRSREFKNAGKIYEGGR
jgi:hypothetical protein